MRKNSFETYQAHTEQYNTLLPLIKELLYTAKYDFNGHHKRGTRWAWTWSWNPKDLREDLVPHSGWEVAGVLSLEEVERLKVAIQTKVPLDTWVTLPLDLSRSEAFKCPYCKPPRGEFAPRLETNGVQIRMDTPCANPDALVDNRFTLNVPSGRLIVANNLCDLTPGLSSRDRDVNRALGRMQTTEDHAQAGLAFGFVGNSCPSVVRRRGDRYTIGNQKGKKLASICTDLWWYSIMDAERAQARAIALGLRADYLERETVINVKPGVYEFTQYNDLDWDASPLIYAEFRRIGPPVIEEDTYLQNYLTQHLSAHQVIAQSLKDYAEQYARPADDDQETAIARVADRLLCTIGTGVGFHPNGHPYVQVDPNTAPITAIPEWKSRQYWYPMPKGSSPIFNAAGVRDPNYARTSKWGIHLNESFQELAYRVLQNLLRYGFLKENAGGYTEEDKQGYWRLLRTAFLGLCERYPETFPKVDPEFTLLVQRDELPELAPIEREETEETLKLRAMLQERIALAKAAKKRPSDTLVICLND